MNEIAAERVATLKNERRRYHKINIILVAVWLVLSGAIIYLLHFRLHAKHDLVALAFGALAVVFMAAFHPPWKRWLRKSAEYNQWWTETYIALSKEKTQALKKLAAIGQQEIDRLEAAINYLETFRPRRGQS